MIAAGARHSYFGNNDCEPFACGLKTIDDELFIREKILLSFEKAERETNPKKRQKYLNFIVVGGGPTGVEMAGSIADIAYKELTKDFRNFNTEQARIYLIEASSKILPMFSDALSEKAQEYLRRFGVMVRTSESVTNITKGQVTTTTDVIDSANIIWAAGNQAAPLLETLDIDLDKQGRVIVDTDCSVPNHPNIFVIGDAAHFVDSNDQALPGIAPVAIQQGRYVAGIIKREIPKENRPKFHYFDKGIMATIGKSRAIMAVGSFELAGLISWLAWCFIHLMYLVGYRNKIIVLIEWIVAYIFNKKGPRLIVRGLK